MQNSDQSGYSSEYPEHHTKRIISLTVAGIILLSVILVAIIYFVALSNTSTETTVTSGVPEAPIKNEVDQIMTSLDEEIEQAAEDQATAESALKDASTPVKVDM